MIRGPKGKRPIMQTFPSPPYHLLVIPNSVGSCFPCCLSVLGDRTDFKASRICKIIFFQPKDLLKLAPHTVIVPQTTVNNILTVLTQEKQIPSIKVCVCKLQIHT